MKRILIVVDMQKDFIDGSLGSPEMPPVAENVARRIRGFEGEIVVTYDTHFENYLETAEGCKLPVMHCIKGTPGWELDPRVEAALKGKRVYRHEKLSFGSLKLPGLVGEIAGGEDLSIELIGVCTGICVVSNALILKAAFPEAPVSVRADCCMCVSSDSHNAALATMRACQIDII